MKRLGTIFGLVALGAVLFVLFAPTAATQPTGWLSYVLQEPQSAVQFRVFGQYGAPGFIGHGTAAPTIANSGQGPINGEFFVVRDNAGANEILLNVYSGSAAAQYSLLYSTLATNSIGAANAVWFGANTVTWEGATADGNETILQAQDADTADHTFQLPDNDAAADTYNLVFSVLDTNALEVANSVWMVSNQIVFEGATANGSEVFITVADNLLGDVTMTIPIDNADWAGAGTFMMSVLATNAPDAANSLWGVSNGLHFEGATADAFENSLQSADVGQDQVVYFGDYAEAATSAIHTTLDNMDIDEVGAVWMEANQIWFEGPAGADAFEIVLSVQEPTVGVQIQLIPDRAVADTFFIHNTPDGQASASQFLLPGQSGITLNAIAAEDPLAGDLDMVCYRAYLPYPMDLTEATIYEYAVGAGAGTFMGLGVYADDDAGALLSVGSTVYAADGAVLVIDTTDVTLWPGWYRWCGCQQTVANQDWLAHPQDSAIMTSVYNETVSEIRYGVAANSCTGNAVAPAATGALATTAESLFVAHFTSQ